MPYLILNLMLSLISQINKQRTIHTHKNSTVRQLSIAWVKREKITLIKWLVLNKNPVNPHLVVANKKNWSWKLKKETFLTPQVEVRAKRINGSSMCQAVARRMVSLSDPTYLKISHLIQISKRKWHHKNKIKTRIVISLREVIDLIITKAWIVQFSVCRH